MRGVESAAPSAMTYTAVHGILRGDDAFARTLRAADSRFRGHARPGRVFEQEARAPRSIDFDLPELCWNSTNSARRPESRAPRNIAIA